MIFVTDTYLGDNYLGNIMYCKEVANTMDGTHLKDSTNSDATNFDRTTGSILPFVVFSD